MKLTTKCQVTIPARIREYLRVAPHGEVDFYIKEGNVLLVKKNPSEDEHHRFSTMRGILKGGLTTQQWMNATRKK